MADTLTPGFFRKTKAGKLLPINGMTQTVKHLLMTVSTYSASANPSYTVGGQWPIGFNLDNLPPDPPAEALYDSAYADRDLRVRALARAKSPDLDLLTTLAELRKTAELFDMAAVRLAQYQEKLAHRARRKAGLKRLKNAAEVFSSLWLESRYGWRLVYYDIQSLCRAVANHGALRSRGFAEARGTYHGTATSTLSTGGNNLYWELKYPVTVEWIERRGVLFEINLSTPNVGFSPIMTGWEIIPWSFVVDWFINVGETLQAFSPRVGFDSPQAWKSRTLITQYGPPTVDLTIRSGSSYTSASASGNDIQGFVRNYSRSPDSAIEPQLPHVNVDLSPGKVVDGLALLITSKSKVIKLLGGRR
jgi:hypothetical protein